MTLEEIKYRVGTVDMDDIIAHLKECKDDFFPPLDQKVNIDDYSRKIIEKAVTFEAWYGDRLIGLIAVYLNDANSISGFITNVSTLKDFLGKGIASRLLQMCINYSMRKNFREILLEVSAESKAVPLYLKYGFEHIDDKNEMMIMRLNLESYNKN